MTYSYLNQNSYTETGGNGAALSVGSVGSSSVRSALGAKVAVPFETSTGTWVPELSVRWVHEYNRTRQATGASACNRRASVAPAAGRCSQNSEKRGNSSPLPPTVSIARPRADRP